MPLLLLTGPANSAKAGAVLDAYRAAREADPLLVVPTVADVGWYRRELALPEPEGAGLVFGSEVVSFAWLVREVAGRTGYAARRVTPLQRDRLVRRAVAAVRLEALAASAASPGFARAAGELFAE